MEPEDILDRAAERPRLTSALRKFDESRDETAAVIVYSERGVGKSALIHAAVHDAGVDVLTVRLSSQAQMSILPPGMYFERMVEAFRERYPDCVLEPKQQWSAGLSFEASFELPTMMPSLGVSASPSRKELRADQRRRLQADAIISYCLSKRLRPTFHLERCNAMDAESLELVHHLARRVHGIRFIFEYSLIHPLSSRAGAIDLRDELSDAVRFTESIPLGRLPLDDATAAINPELENGMSRQELSQLYDESEGNLRVFKELCREAQLEVSRTSQSTTSSNRDMQYVLCLLALNQGCITRDEITAMETAGMQPISLAALDRTVRTLIEEGVIAESPDGIYRLTDLTEDVEILSGPIAYVAYGAFAEYLQRSIEAEMDVDAAFKLLDAQLRFSDHAAIETIEIVKPSICISQPSEAYLTRSVDMARRLVERDGLVSRLTMRTVLALFSVFFAAADYKRASVFLRDSGASEVLPICRFLVDVTEKDASDVDDLREDLERRYANAPRVLLLVKLSYMSHLMRNGTGDAARKYAEDILSESALRAYPEYWWVMKQRSSYVPPIQRITDLGDAARAMRELGSYRMAARTEITLSSELARAGDYERACELLRAGLRECEENHCRANVYMNNIAAAQLASRKCDQNTLGLIRTTMTYVATPYERVLMACNELVALTLLGMKKEAAKVASRLQNERNGSYAAPSLRHAVETNLMYYCASVNDRQGVHGASNRLRSLLPEASEGLARCIEAQLGGNTLARHQSFSYVTRLGYRPTFIGYWQCELEKAHMDEIIACQTG